MTRTSRFRPAVLAALTLTFTLLVAGSVSAGAAGKAKKADGAPTGTPFIFFAADGMRPDLVDKYAKQGAMPTMRNLMNTGLKGQNGLLQVGPTSWTPIGRPSSDQWRGSDTAGCPVTLNAAVNGVNRAARSNCSQGSSGSVSQPTAQAAARGSASAAGRSPPRARRSSAPAAGGATTAAA